MQNAVRVELSKQPTDGPTRWIARVGGGEFPVVAYSAETGDDGEPIVSLAVPATSLQIGDPPTGLPAPQVRPAAPELPKRATWGASGKDPRENIPGWEKSLGEQVAEHAAATA